MREFPTGRSARGLAHTGSGRAFVAGHEIRPGLRPTQAEGPAGNFPVQLAARRLHNRTRRAPPPSLQVRSSAGRLIGAAQSAWGAAGSSPSSSAVLSGRPEGAGQPPPRSDQLCLAICLLPTLQPRTVTADAATLLPAAFSARTQPPGVVSKARGRRPWGATLHPARSP